MGRRVCVRRCWHGRLGLEAWKHASFEREDAEAIRGYSDARAKAGTGGREPRYSVPVTTVLAVAVVSVANVELCRFSWRCARFCFCAAITTRIYARDQTKPSQTKPNRANLNQAKPNQAKPNQTKPNQTSQTKPNEAKPSQAKPSQVKPN